LAHFYFAVKTMFYNERMRFGSTSFDGFGSFSNLFSPLPPLRYGMLADFFSEARVLLYQVLPHSLGPVHFPVCRRAVNLPLPTLESRVREWTSALWHYRVLGLSFRYLVLGHLARPTMVFSILVIAVSPA
jgi:hypothetical protein